VAEAVVAQIFPDRFRRSGRVAAQQGLALQPWGHPPTPIGFQGGDLYGVFNHCCRGFWAFDHLRENGPASPYADWFITEHWPL
jgi:glycosidase